MGPPSTVCVCVCVCVKIVTIRVSVSLYTCFISSLLAGPGDMWVKGDCRFPFLLFLPRNFNFARQVGNRKQARRKKMWVMRGLDLLSIAC
jgi:hypothetical protein